MNAATLKAGLDPDFVLQRLKNDRAAPEQRVWVDANAMPLSELVDHIITPHHACFCQELPRLDRLTGQVHQVHGDKDARLDAARRAFVGLRHERTDHMMKEERILFPMIRRLEQTRSLPSCHGGTIANPIR